MQPSGPPSKGYIVTSWKPHASKKAAQGYPFASETEAKVTDRSSEIDALGVASVSDAEVVAIEATSVGFFWQLTEQPFLIKITFPENYSAFSITFV